MSLRKMKLNDLSDLDLLEELAIFEARESFWAYRQYINNGKLKTGWFQRKISDALQQFYEDLVAGLRPKLVIEAPPQHGKSKSIVEFITWVAGKNPDFRTIYTSFSERLGVRANLTCQRIYDSTKYKKIFPETKISTLGSRDQFGATRNREMLEYVEKEGYFRNTTVRGSITGESLDLGVVDDPIKGRKEAGSKTVRNETWDWFTDDFFTRFSNNAGLLFILTRWHIDDVVGRLKEKIKEANAGEDEDLLPGGDLKVLSFKALATEDEEFRKEGEPLFPTHKSVGFLLERKSTMAAANWEALYQQNPQVLGGEIIRGEHFRYYKQLPIIKYRMVYADTAQKTAERNDYSVLECWGLGDDNRLYLLDLTRNKWEAPELERRFVSFWNKQKAESTLKLGVLRKAKVEDKSSGTGLIQSVRSKGGVPIEGIERNKDRYTRVLDVLGYIESGYIMLPEDAPWVNDFVEECEAFTADDSHLHDDQIDPMLDAIDEMLVANGNKLAIWAKL